MKQKTNTTPNPEAQKQAAAVQQFIESAPVPDFILAAVVDAISDAAKVAGVPVPDLDAPKAEQRRTLAVLFAALPAIYPHHEPSDEWTGFDVLDA
jgi:hypothetical protein